MLAVLGTAGMLTALIGAVLLTVRGVSAARSERRANLGGPAQLMLSGAIAAMAAMVMALLTDDFSLVHTPPLRQHRSDIATLAPLENRLSLGGSLSGVSPGSGVTGQFGAVLGSWEAWRLLFGLMITLETLRGKPPDFDAPPTPWFSASPYGPANHCCENHWRRRSPRSLYPGYDRYFQRSVLYDRRGRSRLAAAATARPRRLVVLTSGSCWEAGRHEVLSADGWDPVEAHRQALLGLASSTPGSSNNVAACSRHGISSS
jgi:hypothetical protein